MQRWDKNKCCDNTIWQETFYKSAKKDKVCCATIRQFERTVVADRTKLPLSSVLGFTAPPRTSPEPQRISVLFVVPVASEMVSISELMDTKSSANQMHRSRNCIEATFLSRRRGIPGKLWTRNNKVYWFVLMGCQITKGLKPTPIFKAAIQRPSILCLEERAQHRSPLHSYYITRSSLELGQ
jgi:hypothetical protein